ncbi:MULTISPECIES: hypothetical protein [unclassified Carboxylicivirga]|uniref:hypothetical protein n=1 Tax=Carboxylicivirga TaxID=1628153 RepID=UPI003D332598
MNQSKNSYNHIRSFADFENEKMKLYYQIKLSEKKMELRYIELLSFLNPMRFVPFLVSSWLRPISTYFKNIIFSFFNRGETNSQDSGHKQSYHEE